MTETDIQRIEVKIDKLCKTVEDLQRQQTETYREVFGKKETGNWGFQQRIEHLEEFRKDLEKKAAKISTVVATVISGILNGILFLLTGKGG